MSYPKFIHIFNGGLDLTINTEGIMLFYPEANNLVLIMSVTMNNSSTLTIPFESESEAKKASNNLQKRLGREVI